MLAVEYREQKKRMQQHLGNGKGKEPVRAPGRYGVIDMIFEGKRVRRRVDIAVDDTVACKNMNREGEVARKIVNK